MHSASTHATAGLDKIVVRGAHHNNLRHVDVDIPKHALTAFTGVSGSGKSSLVFDTIAAESQRLINETYSAFVQGFMPQVERPNVDDLRGLTAAIVVDQEPMAANPRSTVGTVTDAHALLRVLFSRIGSPHVGPPSAFSFNVASVSASGAVTVDRGGKSRAEHKQYNRLGGMCPECEGRGVVSDINLDELFDASKSLNDGPFTIPGYTPDGWNVRIFIGSGFFDPDKPIAKYSARERHDFLYRKPVKISFNDMNLTYEGLIPRIQKSFLSKDRDSLQPHVRAFVDRAATFTTCPECGGTRLNAVARSCMIGGRSIADVCAVELTELPEWIDSIDHSQAGPVVSGLRHTIDSLIDIGLGYLRLDRATGTLSGGESQRIKLVRHLGSALTDITYVFDEPTIGLHPHDIAAMNDLLTALRDKGNTVLVVEHKPQMIRIADHVIDIGPGAGTDGGEIVYQGRVADLGDSPGPTGRHWNDPPRLRDQVRTATDAWRIEGASHHNLQNLTVDVPQGVLVVVTGVAGSGKSSLVDHYIATAAGVAPLNQTSIRGSRRSNPATYSGAFDHIRKVFAKANGVKPGLFSPNSDGACPTCMGVGLIFTDLGFMNTVSSTCEDCEGRRFDRSILDLTVSGHSIADVLDLSVASAAALFATEDAKSKTAATILDRLTAVGLGYLQLGQPLTSLSGGERQRLKLANHLADDSSTVILDEPTTGLHLADVHALLSLLDDLVDSGRSVIIVEHHLQVIAHADWVIDLGPGAGNDGGRIVFEGTPSDLLHAAGSLTGRYLADCLQ